ncbi:ankyrin repeat domain-containing protein [Candidatus Palauibacter sp.]|uniref:ankyrin repeat domain-containing protein n=1 Tax=Candidatus Palauibacter sp. TaxID=3101350 RepID=UPI003AF28736
MKAVALLLGLGSLAAAPSAAAQECDPASLFGPPEKSIFGEGEIDRFRTCLTAGLDVRAVFDPEGRTVLHAAAARAHSAASIRFLLEAGADPNARDASGETPLFDAAQHNHNIAVAEALLEAGADPSTKDDYGYTPMYFSVRNENPGVLLALVEAGADPNEAHGWDRMSLLHRAALWNGGPATARALLSAGADAKARASDGQTPIHYAARNMSKPAVADLLLEAGVPALPLHAAALTGDAATVAALLSDGTHPNLSDRAGWSPLHFAATRNETEILALLLYAGADPNAKVPEFLNATPLHLAVLTRTDVDVVLELLKSGAAPNQAAAGGNTALYFAAWMGQDPAVVEALLDAGADPAIRGSKGYSPADRARNNPAISESDVFERLRSGGRKPPRSPPSL